MINNGGGGGGGGEREGGAATRPRVGWGEEVMGRGERKK